MNFKMEPRFFYHMPFCPYSRKIFFGLREKGLAVQEVLEKTWAPSLELFSLSPSGQLPVLKDGKVLCANEYVSCEYVEEVYPTPALFPVSPSARVEVRKIVSWFDKIFYQDIYLTLFYERALKRHIQKKGPDTSVLKSGRSLLDEHLQTLNRWADERAYLGGTHFSWADITAAAHLSCIDYLGDIPWDKFSASKEWYVKIKSRPTFRAFLGQTFPGLTSALCYSCLDF